MALRGFGSAALARGCLANHGAGVAGAVPRDTLHVQRVTQHCFVHASVNI